jgi:hypothetical protein
MQHSEKGYAAAGSGAQISNPVGVAEKAEAHGIYHVNCQGPVEHLREQYCALRDRLDAKGFRGFMDRLINGKKVLADFLAIPIEQKWAEDCPNVVTTVGKNYALDGYLQTAVTIVGPYMFLINTNASAAVVGDTMASHAGWLEVGATNDPDYTAPRKTCAWSAAAAGSKALSSALSFAMLNAGTVGGCGIVLGTGAVSTIDSTAGVLYSAGAFTGGSKTVGNGDTLNVSYTASL